jgi:Ecdysteroid kinase-like family
MGALNRKLRGRSKGVNFAEL